MKVNKMIEVIHIKKDPDCINHPDYVYIGRGSKYGNPFSHLGFSTAHVKVANRNEAIEKYTLWVNGFIDIPGLKPPTKEDIVKLKGKILGCFCKPLPCHGDVLKSLAEEYTKE